MPHAISMPSPGLQALILCGPGSSFPTFTANPDENPKALLPIANRPMVWYPIDFCYRMGVTDITLICPPSASEAMTTGLRTNPYLTAFPLPRPGILAPKDLDQNTGTAAILRLPEVKSLITSDFLVLPCDLICELPGDGLLQAWMTCAASLPEVLGVAARSNHPGSGSLSSSHRSGGLGVWYETKQAGAEPIKGEEKDFIAVVPTAINASSARRSKGSLIPNLKKLVLATPMDSLKDQMAEEKGLRIRHGLLRRHHCVSMLTTKRDAHIYVFPRWVVDFVAANDSLESIGEDLVGWWAKAGWQAGLAEKIGLAEVLHNKEGGDAHTRDGTVSPPDELRASQLLAKGSSSGSNTNNHHNTNNNNDNNNNNNNNNTHAGGHGADDKASIPVPPMLAYIHPSAAADAPLIRRVDTTNLLLTTSLRLAKLPSAEEGSVSPFAHRRKVSYPEGVKSRTTITRADSLVGDNVTVSEKTSIKESVIGAASQIGQGSKLAQCLLMEGVVVGKGCRLTKCVLGKRAMIGDGAVLTECEVQENLIVEAGTEERGSKMMSSEGLEASDEEME